MRNIQSRRFTLLELLAVIAIITVLVGLIIGGVSAGMRKASEAKTRGRMHQLEVALEQYRIDWGYYPISTGTACSQYKVHSDDPAEPVATISVVRWNAWSFSSPSSKPYLEEYPVAVLADKTPDRTPLAIFNDGFDNPFYYRCPGIMNPESYDLWSAGADGLFGGNPALAVYAGCETTTTCNDITLGHPTAFNAHKRASTKPSRALIPADNDDITNWKRQ